MTIPPTIPPPSLLARLPPRLKGFFRRLALTYLEQRERRRFDSRRVIWVLAHMRSGSTLLMHLLSSHPEILGSGERNAVYSSPNDLLRLSVSAAYARRQLFRDYRYVVDQINHDRFLASPGLLDHPQLYKIFLIREPQAALSSMVETLGRHYGLTLDEGMDYYLERLPTLARYAQAARDGSRSFFLTYDDLLTHPQRVLRHLEAFLQLRSPLSESYQRFAFTGGSGDPSERIRSGRILPSRRSAPLNLSDADLTRVRRVYADSSEALESSCRTIEGDSVERHPAQPPIGGPTETPRP